MYCPFVRECFLAQRDPGLWMSEQREPARYGLVLGDPTANDVTEMKVFGAKQLAHCRYIPERQVFPHRADAPLNRSTSSRSLLSAIPAVKPRTFLIGVFLLGLVAKVC